jgi:serine/threonine-protein kinase HipA
VSLRVWLHGEPVGTLVVDHADWIRFDVAEDYWEREPRPIVSLALESDRGRSVTRSHLVLPPLFSNLLPEGALRDQIASHHGLDIRREMPLLERLGEDLAGAMCFTEIAREDGPPAPPELVGGDAAWAFSAVAGMQPKFTTERLGKGLVLAAKGHGERWIVKMVDGKFDRLPETEELMTRWAKAAGIDTVEAIRGNLAPYMVARAVVRGEFGRAQRARGAWSG